MIHFIRNGTEKTHKEILYHFQIPHIHSHMVDLHLFTKPIFKFNFK